MKSDSSIKIELIGHTDNTGSSSLNKRLSVGRAKAVYNYLLSKGVPKNQMEYDGKGETDPKYSNDTAKNRKKNRRVEIRY